MVQLWLICLICKAGFYSHRHSIPHIRVTVSKLATRTACGQNCSHAPVKSNFTLGHVGASVRVKTINRPPFFWTAIIRIWRIGLRCSKAQMGLMTFTGKWDQYTSAVTNDSYSYQWELNPVHWVQIQQSNHCTKAVPFFFSEHRIYYRSL